MGRRNELKREIEIIQAKINAATDATPPHVVEGWHKELYSLTFELENLYDEDNGNFEC